ncbi:MAG: hypothetical protein J6P28_04495 [Treponema sp.]|nr:hypothetical protein [Treponema sp.]MBQ1712996.1 hypothetical protein [Treponema sp.]MBQ1869340.1 hypothetical protein [Treponema sp.]MBQ2464331.1 hypothetical protein [Treponema sp.]MBR0476259.1 hypothetical protein [Treponema sp.]
MVTKVYKIITGKASYSQRLEFFDIFLLERTAWSYCSEGYAIPKLFLISRFAGFRLTPPLLAVRPFDKLRDRSVSNGYAALPIGARLYGKNAAKA